MKTLIWIVGIVALAVAVTLAARYNTGYVLLVLPPYRIEFSLNFLIVLLVAGFAAGYVLVRTVFATLHLPRQVREYRLARRRTKRGRHCSRPCTNISPGATAARKKPPPPRSISASTLISPRCWRRAPRTSCVPTSGATLFLRGPRRRPPGTRWCASSPRSTCCSTSVATRRR